MSLSDKFYNVLINGSENMPDSKRSADSRSESVVISPRLAPPITYPEDLPVSGRRQEIAAAIVAHQVVIVSGETGSGKTTQVPQMLLADGIAGEKLIVVLQPRRVAARSVAVRVAHSGSSRPL